ncbi:hypothetical protein GCM10009648_18040 [Tsukamurella spumae]
MVLREQRRGDLGGAISPGGPEGHDRRIVDALGDRRGQVREVLVPDRAQRQPRGAQVQSERWPDIGEIHGGTVATVRAAVTVVFVRHSQR